MRPRTTTSATSSSSSVIRPPSCATPRRSRERGSMSLVEVQVEEGFAVLTLNDPDRRNALNLPMCDEMVAAVDALEADDTVNALIVTGTPPAFCAGADLSHLGSSQRDGLLRVYEGFLRVARSTLPTIAAVNGAAVGAGMNLAPARDVRLARRSAPLATPVVPPRPPPGGGPP